MRAFWTQVKEGAVVLELRETAVPEPASGQLLVRVPASLSWEQAAAVPIVFAVVRDMLIAQGRPRPAEWLLVTGVSSGVGVAALQAGKALGAQVIGTSGSAEKLERPKALGLDVALRTRAPDAC